MADGRPHERPGGGDVCSASHAGWLTTPLRRLITDPKRILRGLISEGDHVVDLGCGPGFFTLPMAEMVGPSGQVTAVDLQAEMLAIARRRAERRGLAARIRLHQCAADSIGRVEPADLVLAFYVVHEVPDVERFLGEVHGIVKAGGRLLLIEPRGHVSEAAFEQTVALAGATGMKPVARPRVAFSRGALFERV